MVWDEGNSKQQQIAQSGLTGMGALIPPPPSPSLSLIERTQFELSMARSEVQRLEELVKMLEKWPEINRILELLGRRY